MLHKDFKDMLQSLLDEKVEFLLIGGYAMAAYGCVRFTKDIDIWVGASDENAPKILSALRRFGAPISGLSVKDFTSPGTLFQIGVSPVRIDITSKVDGVTFKECYANKEEADMDGMTIPIISRADLVRNKKASGRRQDLLDVENLKLPESEK